MDKRDIFRDSQYILNSDFPQIYSWDQTSPTEARENEVILETNDLEYFHEG